MIPSLYHVDITSHLSGRLLRCASALCLLSACFPAGAAEGSFPVHPVRWIVPYTAGGSIDLVARIVANKLSGIWGQQIVIDNKIGAGGRLGVQAVVSAPPDGYTQLLTLNSNYTIDRSLFKDLNYDPEKALAPVTIAASTAQLLIANPAFAAKTVKELIALAKARPNEINYGSSGAGGSLHLAMELFKWMTGVKMTHIAYRGGVIAATDLMSGQIAIMFLNAPSAVPYIKSGKVRALGISTAQRSPLVPEVPTIAEAGVPGFNIEAWYGLSVPTGTVAAIINKTYQDLTQVLKLADVRKQLADAGADPVSLTPDETAKRIKAESATWAKVIQGSTIRFE
jgi:tripartite-type tricarboxylate transporter receptor subunit TctC